MSVVVIATFFLASFTVVYGTYFICNTDLTENIIASHSHDDDHHSEATDHDKHSHEHSEPSDDECCNDLTFAFFNDAKLLAKQLQVGLSSIGEAIIAPLVTSNLINFENFGSQSHFIDPPPKTVHRRILYQSFTI